MEEKKRVKRTKKKGREGKKRAFVTRRRTNGRGDGGGKGGRGGRGVAGGGCSRGRGDAEMSTRAHGVAHEWRDMRI